MDISSIFTSKLNINTSEAAGYVYKSTEKIIDSIIWLDISIQVHLFFMLPTGNTKDNVKGKLYIDFIWKKKKKQIDQDYHDLVNEPICIGFNQRN